MSSKQGGSNGGAPSVFVIFFLMFILFSFVNLTSSFPTENAVSEFRKQHELFSRLFPAGKGFYSFAMDLMLSAQRSAVKYQDFWQAFFQEPLSALSIAFSALFAQYVLIAGVVYAFFIYASYTLLLLAIATLGFALYKYREYFQDMLIKHKAKRLNPFKSDEKITYLISLFLKNPVPASILHHNPYEGGLLKHSLNVARTSAKLAKERGLSVKKAFLAGLVHDIGKLKIYRKEKAKGKAPAPSPLERWKGGQEKEEYVWTALQVNQEVVNKLFLKELSDKLKLDIPKEPEIWMVVKMADRMETEKELRGNIYNIRRFLVPALKILADSEEGKRSMWRKGDHLIVLAHALNRTITELMLEEDKTLPLSPEPDKSGVHVIAYSVVKQLPLVKEINGVKADDLGLFDVKIGGKRFKAVYVLPAKYLQEVPETPEKVEFLARAQD